MFPGKDKYLHISDPRPLSVCTTTIRRDDLLHVGLRVDGLGPGWLSASHYFNIKRPVSCGTESPDCSTDREM